MVNGSCRRDKALTIALISNTRSICKRIGVSISTVIRWESGKSYPNIAGMKSLKQFCDNQQYSFQSLQDEWIKK